MQELADYQRKLQDPTLTQEGREELERKVKEREDNIQTWKQWQTEEAEKALRATAALQTTGDYITVMNIINSNYFIFFLHEECMLVLH